MIIFVEKRTMNKNIFRKMTALEYINLEPLRYLLELMLIILFFIYFYIHLSVNKKWDHLN